MRERARLRNFLAEADEQAMANISGRLTVSLAVRPISMDFILKEFEEAWGKRDFWRLASRLACSGLSYYKPSYYIRRKTMPRAQSLLSMYGTRFVTVDATLMRPDSSTLSLHRGPQEI